MNYIVLSTYEFAVFMAELRDLKARAAIAVRIDRLRGGLMGDAKPVGSGVSELRIAVGPGYRVYFTVRDREVVILLCAGDKGTQRADIAKAQRMAQDF